MRAVILKQSIPGPRPGQTHQRGARIKVSDADYARLVPKLAHDADEHLAAEVVAKEKRDKDNPEGVKMHRDLREARSKLGKQIREKRGTTKARAKAAADRTAKAKMAVAAKRLERLRDAASPTSKKKPADKPPS